MSELKISEGARQDTSLPSTSDTPEQEFCQILRNGSKLQICRALLEEYFRGCSIQGCKYFCERKRHWSEGVFWIVIFSIAICLSCTMIASAWQKWDQTPVIVSLSEKSSPIWKIPFPAVTICPEVKTTVDENGSNFSQIYRKLDGNANMSEPMLNRLRAFLQLCNDEWCSDCKASNKSTTDESVLYTIYNMSIKLDKTVRICTWRDKVIECSEYFRTILTEEGICFTLNSLNSEDIYTKEMSTALFQKMDNQSAEHWNLEDGYDDGNGGWDRISFYPLRVLSTGSKSGLEVILRLEKMDFDYMCLGSFQGFKVTLHSPAEIPQPSKHYFHVPLNTEVSMSVKPNMMETSKGLNNYAPARKQCYLNSERKLRFFKVYTQRHCELECLANYTLQRCGCVSFSHPRAEDTPICDIGKMDCIRKSIEELAEETFLNALNNIDKITEQGCFCLPACTSIQYEVEISQSKLDWERDLKEFSGILFNETYNSGFTIGYLRIYFRDNEFITSKRTELYGLTDFVAACGGLVGLFIGVTALSIVEIFYYFTLRLVWTLRMYRYGKRKDSPNRQITLNT